MQKPEVPAMASVLVSNRRGPCELFQSDERSKTTPSRSPPQTHTQEFLLDCYFHHSHAVKVMVAERLEAHGFCSTARGASCWFESHSQQSTFFFFYFLFLFFYFSSLSFLFLLSHSTVFEKTRNHLNRMGGGGGHNTLFLTNSL